MKGRRSFHVPGSMRHPPPDKEYRTEHIKIQLKVDLESKSIQGSCTLRVVPIRPGLSAVHFDAKDLRVAKVELDGRQSLFDHDGETLTVRSESPLAASAHEAVVWYSAKPKNGVFFVHPDRDYPNKPIQAWTQFEAEAARHCYPCHDHPDDKSTSEMILTVPDGYQTVSNGKLLSEESKDGWTTTHWSESAPHSTYLNSFAVGKFGEIDAEAEGVPLQYLFPEEKREDALRCFGLTPDMLKTFNQIIGVKYPYGKYAQVAVHDFIYGGMENIGATTLVDTRFPDERSEEDYAARYSRPDRTHIELISHELAHMWFGDLVTMRHWSHGWVNEGSATYFEALYHEKRFGVDELRENLSAKAAVHFEEDESRYRRPIVDDDYIYADDLFDTFLYEKAAWMIHQLRYVLGDEAFFKGIKEYVGRFQYKNADTHDYMRVMEEVSGRSLEAYFEQAFFRAGHPEIEVGYDWDPGTSTATLTVKQVQHTDELTPIFKLPCDVVFYTTKGRVKKRVNIDAAEATYHFELDSEPTVVEIDPEEWLLKKITFRKSRKLLVNQLESSIDSSSRKRAAEGLAAFPGDETVEILEKAALREQYWSVRTEAVKSMGKVGGKKALESLLTLAGIKNRRVRRAVIAALSNFKGEERVRILLKAALLGDESPYVQCEAALSVGKTGPVDALATLTEAMKLPSPEHGVTEASIEALGYLKSREARAMVRENLPYGLPTRVRIGALKAYMRLGSFEEEDLAVLKEIALHDKDFAVRDQLLETMAEVADTRFLETLRKVAEGDEDNRNRRRAVELVEELSSGDAGGSVASLREEVEKLKGQHRDLSERVSGMELS